MGLEYRVDILATLKEKGYNTNQLRKQKLLAEGVIQSLREQKPISWSNIEKLCVLLNCQPGDFLFFNKICDEDDGQPENDKTISSPKQNRQNDTNQK